MHMFTFLVGSKQQKYVLSPSWRPEICNQGVRIAILPLKALWENLLFPTSDNILIEGIIVNVTTLNKNRFKSPT